MTSQYNDQQYLDYVKENCVAQGDVDTGACEIDSDSVVSTNDDAHGSDGAYVQVWMWVDDACVQDWIQETDRSEQK